MGFNYLINNFISIGKDQVSVGIVPVDYNFQTSESAESVYPLAIANCKEDRSVRFFLV